MVISSNLIVLMYKFIGTYVSPKAWLICRQLGPIQLLSDWLSQRTIASITIWISAARSHRNHRGWLQNYSLFRYSAIRFSCSKAQTYKLAMHRQASIISVVVFIVAVVRGWPHLAHKDTKTYSSTKQGEI